MRIKFLSFIASFFMVSLFITSCLDNDESVEYSSDATIRAFGLDTIGYGINYKFTIDQISGLIYNEDSLPVHADTIIDRILIKTLNTSSGIVTMKDKNGEDSIINIADSIDLTKYVNAPTEGKYLALTVYAPDMLTKKTYNVSIRVHHHDPDSLMWKYSGKLQDVITGPQKTITYKNEFLTYSVIGTQLKVYKNSGWSTWTGAGHDVNGLSSLPTSLLSLDNVILATINERVYESTDGINWVNSTRFDGTVNTLISKLPIGLETQITYIKTEDGKRYFYSKLGLAGVEKKGEEAGNFPVSNISFATFKKGNNYQNMIVGKHDPEITIDINEKKTPITVAWGYDGETWAELGAQTSIAYCPAFENPTIIYYNDLFYVWGDKFESIYVSLNEGIAWKKANKKFSFPHQDWTVSGFVPSIEKPEFRGRKNFSVVQDTEKDYIYILFGKEIGVTFTEEVKKGETVDRGPYNHDSEVWRGRLNQLWFDLVNSPK